MEAELRLPGHACEQAYRRLTELGVGNQIVPDKKSSDRSADF
jgi:hypothetical protein